MSVFLHIGLFVGAFVLIWLFAGLFISAVERVARYFHRSGFVVAFIFLGILTSLTEISVALNSSIQQVPQVSVGNLSSASLVIFLLVIPILAFFGKGIHLKGSISDQNLILALIVIGLAPLIAMMGTLRPIHGVILIMAYLILVYCIAQQKTVVKHALKGTHNIRTITLFRALLQLGIGAVVIFLAGRVLVSEAVYFADYVAVPSSVMGIVLLSIGTNFPELTIAVRAVMRNRKAIAFGDYLGSAAMNTLLLGVLILFNGSFMVHRPEFVITAILGVVGLSLFLIFARSKHTISRGEAVVLASVYAVFLIGQIVTIVHDRAL